LNVLVDTSVWSLALRRKSRDLNPKEKVIVTDLSELVREGRARLIGLVRQELLSGIKSAENHETLRRHLRYFPDEVIDTSDHEEAAKFGNRCRGKGIGVSIVDILLCAVATNRQWAIFTTDPDVMGYAKVIPISIHAPRKEPKPISSQNAPSLHRSNATSRSPSGLRLNLLHSKSKQESQST
jgi:predicted nucleic acid-binding protein